MTTWSNRLFWLAALALGLWAIWESAVFVDETELVVVTNFGELAAVYDQPATDSHAGDRGWHWKLPWHSVRRFDRRLQVFDTPAREMVTHSGQQQAAAGELGGSEVGGNLTVGCYVCWRIPGSASQTDGKLDERPVVRFLRSVRTSDGAELRLDKLVRSKLGAEIATVELADLLHVAAAGDKSPSLIREIGRRVTDSLQSLKDEAGIEVVDVQIRRLNLPEGNRSAVYARQKSERQRIANKYRAEGKAEATKISSQAARESEAVLAQAQAKAQAIRGEGEAAAAETYAAAYGRDPEFFRLLRTLQAYEEMLGAQTTVILSADSPMFKLLRDGLQSLESGTKTTEPATKAPPAAAKESAKQPLTDSRKPAS